MVTPILDTSEGRDITETRTLQRKVSRTNTNIHSLVGVYSATFGYSTIFTY